VSAAAEVTLLTQQNCASCEVAKEILARLGREYPLRVREIDLAGPEGQRLAAAAGVLFAPGVLLDREPFSFGRLSERKLRRTLDRRARDGQLRPT
jgi:predicted ABC-type transport system involved in lysophospholipase L1 biosynthesis ATPase subunit